MTEKFLIQLKQTLEKEKAARIIFEKKYARVKCNCGCYMKDHFEKRGWCSKNGCTWYWPNDKYLLKQKK